MSYNIIIDGGGTTKSVSVDRLRVKNKDGGTTDYAPPTRYPYAKLIVYRNGTYNAADYGLTGFTSVEVKVGSRRDGRSCDTEYTDPEGVTASQSIEVGGLAREFHAGAIGVRMGTDAVSEAVIQWRPCEASLTTSATTISHQGTHTPPTGAAWSSVTVNISGSEIMDTPGAVWTIPTGETEPQPPESYIDPTGSGNWLKIRYAYKESGWHLLEGYSPYGDMYIGWGLEPMAYYVSFDVVSVAIIRAIDGRNYPFTLSGDGEVLPPNSYNTKMHVECMKTELNDRAYGYCYIPAHSNTEPIKTKIIKAPQGQGRYSTYHTNIKIKTRVKLHVTVSHGKEIYFRGYNPRYWEYGHIQLYSHSLEEVYEGNKKILDDGTSIYCYPTTAGLTRQGVSLGWCMAPYCNIILPKNPSFLYAYPGMPYGALPSPDAIPTVYYCDLDVRMQAVTLPVTDVLYLGDEATAPDWAKTITDYDL